MDRMLRMVLSGLGIEDIRSIAADIAVAVKSTLGICNLIGTGCKGYSG
jgi:hypothetical protein